MGPRTGQRFASRDPVGRVLLLGGPRTIGLDPDPKVAGSIQCRSMPCVGSIGSYDLRTWKPKHALRSLIRPYRMEIASASVQAFPLAIARHGKARTTLRVKCSGQLSYVGVSRSIGSDLGIESATRAGQGSRGRQGHHRRRRRARDQPVLDRRTR